MISDDNRIIMFGWGMYDIYEIILVYDKKWTYKIVKTYLN